MSLQEEWNYKVSIKYPPQLVENVKLFCAQEEMKLFSDKRMSPGELTTFTTKAMLHYFKSKEIIKELEGRVEKLEIDLRNEKWEHKKVRTQLAQVNSIT